MPWIKVLNITGPRGIPGPCGMTGPRGQDGIDGKDGADSPYIISVEIDQDNYGGAEFIFELSDGRVIRSNTLKVPRPNVYSATGASGGAKGADGKSAYDIAVENGFIGTEQDWLDSLVGPQGPAGADGQDGADGDSAYQVAVNNGFVGTEQDWLDSLVGPQGPPGTGGTQVVLLDCDSDVYVGAVVKIRSDNQIASKMSEWTTLAALLSMTAISGEDIVAELAIADSYSGSLAIGIVQSKPSSTTCNVVLAGPTSNLYLGLDANSQYYLSDEIPGLIVPESLKPSDVGHYIVRIGQPLSSKELCVSRGDIFQI